MPPDAEAVSRDAERVADRLRVVGPRLQSRQGAQADASLAAVRATVQQLADLAADAEGLPRRSVPALQAYALGDQILVLVHDVVATGDPGALSKTQDVLRALRRLV